MDNKENVKNEYDEDSRETKDRYLSQIKAISQFIKRKLISEIEYRKKKADKLAVELEDYWREVNPYGYSSEITGMPHSASRSDTSSVERIVMKAAKIEDELKKYQVSSDEERIKELVEADEKDAYEVVFSKVAREHPLYHTVYNEIMDVIQGVSNASAVLILEDRYMKDMPWKAIASELEMSTSKVNYLWHAALDEIQIPQAQRERKWIKW